MPPVSSGPLALPPMVRGLIPELRGLIRERYQEDSQQLVQERVHRRFHGRFGIVLGPIAQCDVRCAMHFPEFGLFCSEDRIAHFWACDVRCSFRNSQMPRDFLIRYRQIILYMIVGVSFGPPNHPHCTICRGHNKHTPRFYSLKNVSIVSSTFFNGFTLAVSVASQSNLI